MNRDRIVIFRHVIIQAINDARGLSANCRREYSAAEVREDPTLDGLTPMAEARRWFQDGGDDFNDVCDRAELEPDAVRRIGLDFNGSKILLSTDDAISRFRARSLQRSRHVCSTHPRPVSENIERQLPRKAA